MLQWKRNQAAFTLIELLVVVIIVAVLAAVGVPLLSAAVERAKATEAEAGLGTIRTSLRAHYAEVGPSVGYSDVSTGNPVTALPDLQAGDLDGRWFDEPTYNIQATDIATYCIEVDGTNSTAPKAAEVDGSGAGSSAVQRSMDQDGTIFNGLGCT